MKIGTTVRVGNKSFAAMTADLRALRSSGDKVAPAGSFCLSDYAAANEIPQEQARFELKRLVTERKAAPIGVFYSRDAANRFVRMPHFVLTPKPKTKAK